MRKEAGCSFDHSWLLFSLVRGHPPETRHPPRVGGIPPPPPGGGSSGTQEKESRKETFFSQKKYPGGTQKGSGVPASSGGRWGWCRGSLPDLKKAWATITNLAITLSSAPWPRPPPGERLPRWPRGQSPRRAGSVAREGCGHGGSCILPKRMV